MLSRPERGTVVIGAGRRDVSSDSGLPVLLRGHGRSGPVDVRGAVADRLFDQHLVVTAPDGCELSAGDEVAARASPTRAPRSTSGAGSLSSTTASTSSTWSAPSSEPTSVHPARAQAAAHGQPANAAGGSPATPGRCRKTEPARG